MLEEVRDAIGKLAYLDWLAGASLGDNPFLKGSEEFDIWEASWKAEEDKSWR